ncbi:MAG TPA: acylphosphatase [Rhodocyclaceae bacterium]|nr:acylphosphatase [Rhodocyclaceae bacterium]HNH34362.1 acylphosphatase [Rhodocyclaceae bacterium]
MTTDVRRLVVTGIVQGVGYRAAFLREAERRDLTGWVRNRRDGSVEAMIAGSDEAVAGMIAWARRGPPGSRVDHVAVEFGHGSFDRFSLRSTE